MLRPIQSLAILTLICASAYVCGAQIKPVNLPSYDTKYYKIYSDLDKPAIAEVSVRLTKIAEVYAERTRGFSGVIRQKLPFYLFRNAEDYHAAGGAPGSAGVFTGSVLMAVAGEKLNGRTWHVIQHEGFHQFAHAVIGGDIPTWVNEGLAEYFGEGIFTGDDLFTGAIPEWRRQRIVKQMAARQFASVDRIMNMSLHDWNDKLSVMNYDQAWSMVQFLAHGDGGKYQGAFTNYMNAIGKGRSKSDAWQSSFGSTAGFEDRWREFWLKLPENPTDDIYRRATVSTLTSFIARAFIQGQNFETMREFASAASEDRLNIAIADALPRSLLAAAMEDVGKRLKAGDDFRIEHTSDRHPMPIVVLQTHSGERIVGTFTLSDGHVSKVSVEDFNRRAR